ncbi:MAG: type II secretion system F family protein [bacterium]|nr:type II secretion system F family protein [bacterium]
MTAQAPFLERAATPDPDALRVGQDAAAGRPLVGLFYGLVTALGLLLTSLYVELAWTLGALVGALAWVIDGQIVASRSVRIEGQLADALDLLGSSVAAGVGLVEALDGVVRESRGPLRQVLGAAAERLRLGDDPQRVFEEAWATLPVPAFRLLTHYLSVQWQSGGALAPGLHAIAETVRDRVNLSRRVHGQSAEARFSVLGILAVVYGIALLAWTNNPERVTAFLGSGIGGGIAAACVLLQAGGVIWMARLTRIEV